MTGQEMRDPGLPGLDCGSCGYGSCSEFAARLAVEPSDIHRCIHRETQPPVPQAGTMTPATCAGCGTGARAGTAGWTDTLGREYDFVLDTLPGDPGPRETILPHNPMITRELDIRKGDVLIGRPLGMSCGCPITHCGVVVEVDHRTGVIVWCVTGPLRPRQEGFKDLGYYIAEAYDGIVRDTRHDLKIGMRYFFLPHRCMLQWRHSGLVNFIARNGDETRIRVEGLWIG